MRETKGSKVFSKMTPAPEEVNPHPLPQIHSVELTERVALKRSHVFFLPRGLWSSRASTSALGFPVGASPIGGFRPHPQMFCCFPAQGCFSSRAAGGGGEVWLAFSPHLLHLFELISQGAL